MQIDGLLTAIIILSHQTERDELDNNVLGIHDQLFFHLMYTILNLVHIILYYNPMMWSGWAEESMKWNLS